jgi:DNA-binding NtrC family response regulator
VRELRSLIERIVILNPQVRIDARRIVTVTRRTAQAPPDRFGSLQEARKQPSGNTFSSSRPAATSLRPKYWASSEVIFIK